MRVFVTGATGFIGSAVVPTLIGMGHQVVGLARTDEAAAKLAAWGAEAHRGELADTDGLAAAARASDGVIHLAFIHDFANYAASNEADQRAIKAMLGAIEGSGKPFVGTSGTLMAAHARPATEATAPASPDGPRAAAEAMVLATDRGYRGSVVRLPPVVHGREAQGLLTGIIPVFREKGVAVYVGEGVNVWPATERRDAARVFSLALERADAGSRLHAVAEEGIAWRSIAEAIGEGLGVPVRSVTAEEAPEYFQFFAGFAAADNPTSSTVTRERLGWRPQEAGLLEGLRNGSYLGA